MNLDFYDLRWDFADSRVFSATAADNPPFLIADTSAAGTPTYAVQDGAESGALDVDFDNTSEVQNVCVFQNDKLAFDIDKIVEVNMICALKQAAVDPATSAAWGLIGDRNDAIDSIAQAAIFRLIGSTSLVVETDDGTNNNDDVPTGQSLGTAFKRFTISFATGKADVRFFVDGQPVAQGTTFDLSAYSGSLQLMPLQLQKTADTNTDGFRIKTVQIRGRNK